MGIKDLFTFLKKKCPDVFKVLPLNLLKGKKVAIDAHNIMYTKMATALKDVLNETNVIIESPDKQEITKRWISSILDFAAVWTRQGCTPIFVFDGKPVAQKDKTREERKEAKVKKLKEIEELKNEIDVSDPLTHTPKMLIDLRKKMSHLTVITKEQQEELTNTFKLLGIPYRIAKYDGEQLCSMMCREGIVSAVYSKDTDNLVYGCPLLLTDYAYTKKGDNGDPVPYYTAINYDDVIKELELSKEQFVDFCITLGCDFNERMPLIGPVKGYNLIKKHGSIDKYPQDEKTLSLLDHVTCRKIFTPSKSSELTDYIYSDSVNPIFAEDAREILEQNNLSGYLGLFFNHYENMKKKKSKFVINT